MEQNATTRIHAKPGFKCFTTGAPAFSDRTYTVDLNEGNRYFIETTSEYSHGYLRIGYLYHDSDEVYWEVIECKKDGDMVRLGGGCIDTPDGEVSIKGAGCRFKTINEFTYALRVESRHGEDVVHYTLHGEAHVDDEASAFELTSAKCVATQVPYECNYRAYGYEFVGVRSGYLICAGYGLIDHGYDEDVGQITTPALCVEIYDPDTGALKSYYLYTVPDLLAEVSIFEGDIGVYKKPEHEGFLTFSLIEDGDTFGQFILEEQNGKVICHEPMWCHLTESSEAFEPFYVKTS